MSNVMKGWELLFCSALLFACAYQFPYYCDWLIFFFLVPIFVGFVSDTFDSPGKAGFIWGILFFSVLWSEIFSVIIDQAEGNAKFFLPILLIIYAAGHTGLWFWVSVRGAQRIRFFWLKNCYFIVLATLFFLFLHRYVLWITGVAVGCCLCLPLVPLAQHPAWLASLWFFKIEGLMLILVGAALCCAIALVRGALWSVNAWLLLMLPFYSGWLVHQDYCLPSYVASIGYLRPKIINNDPYQAALCLNESIADLIERNRDLETIMMPESSYPFALNDYQAAIELLGDCPLQENLHLVLGAHGNIEGGITNTLYILHDQCITDSYDKNSLMPFTEYIPPVWRWSSWARALFFNKKKEFIPQNSQRKALEVAPGKFALPFICCEIFFSYPSSSTNTKIPFVCLINDGWFKGSALSHFLYLFARLKALEWQQDMLYVSHKRGSWFCPSGLEGDLATL